MGRGGNVRKGKSRKGTRRQPDRIQILQELRASVTSAWINSDNPIKKRVARLEVAWREGLQWVLEDIQKMFGNFEVIGDAYDDLDINIASLKALLVEKQVITEEEFEAKKQYFIGVMNAERQRRQEELERLQAEAEKKAQEDAETDAKVAEAEAQASDGSKVTSELKRMHKAATESDKDNIEVPDGATVFGGF